MQYQFEQKSESEIKSESGMKNESEIKSKSQIKSESEMKSESGRRGDFYTASKLSQLLSLALRNYFQTEVDRREGRECSI